MGNTHAALNLKVEYPKLPANSSKWAKFKHRCYQYIQVSTRSPATIGYFKSEVGLLNEKKRQYYRYRYIVHPLSQFNYYYEIFCLFFYLLLIYFKTFDFGFLYLAAHKPNKTAVDIALAFDILSLANISFQFCIGYCVPKDGVVELSRKKICKRYLYSGHFICDVLSSVPRRLTSVGSTPLELVVSVFALLKIRRISTVFMSIHPATDVVGVKSSSVKFLCSFVTVIFLVMHIMTCFHVGVPQFRHAITDNLTGSWIEKEFLNRPVTVQYMIAFFGTAQYTFLIRVDDVFKSEVPEEIILGIVNFFIGKLLLLSIWIVLLYTFLSQRMLRVKFEEIMTELNQYMVSRKLPSHLRKRLSAYYKYKYQKVFFNEIGVRNVLSENLKREIDVFLCKSLIKHVSLFHQVSPKKIKQILSFLVPQIFLANDTIMQSGAIGDCMYFIESGTVAVYTPSGRELYHLTDGAYFGEVSVILKNIRRPVTVIALEITRVFIFSKHHFQICFQKDDPVFKTLAHQALEVLTKAKSAEELHKSGLFKSAFAI